MIGVVTVAVDLPGALNAPRRHPKAWERFKYLAPRLGVGYNLPGVGYMWPTDWLTAWNWFLVGQSEALGKGPEDVP